MVHHSRRIGYNQGGACRLEHLIARADEAMYVAQRGGKNAVVIAAQRARMGTLAWGLTTMSVDTSTS